VQRGHDPADFALYAYGGAAPQYAGRYAEDLGVREVVVPALASVFSAYGAAATDLRALAEVELRPEPLERAVRWLPATLAEAPAGLRRAVVTHELFHVQRRDWLAVLAEALAITHKNRLYSK